MRDEPAWPAMNEETRMTPPPSRQRKIVKVPVQLTRISSRKQPTAGAMSTLNAEKDSPWVPFGENAAIKHLSFDMRHNIYSNILWMKGPGVDRHP